MIVLLSSSPNITGKEALPSCLLLASFSGARGSAPPLYGQVREGPRTGPGKINPQPHLRQVTQVCHSSPKETPGAPPLALEDLTF